MFPLGLHETMTKKPTNRRQQSQSNRADNQRPNSQGYGAGGAGPGTGSFQAEGSNSLLAGQAGDAGADATGYVYGQPGHNGAAGGEPGAY
jgi:hypothetical protein